MNDENYAVNYLKFATDKKWTPQDALMVEHCSLISWASGNLIGGLIGSTVTIDLEIVDFALTALFIYMIVMQMRSHLSLIICLTSTALSLFFLTLTKSTLGIIIATLIASLIGFAIEDWVRKHSKDPKNAWVLKRLFRPAMTRHTVEDRQMLSEKKAQQAAQVEAANDSGEE